MTLAKLGSYFICFALLQLFLVAIPPTGAEPKSRVACLDENGKAVDWYIGYKFPKIKTDTRFNTGYAYAYLTSEQASENQAQLKKAVELPEHGDSKLSSIAYRFRNLLLRYAGFGNKATEERASKKVQPAKEVRWSLSTNLINDQHSALLRTVAAAYDPQISAVLYNDDSGEVENRNENDDGDDEGDSNSETGTERAQQAGRTERKKRHNNSQKAHAKGVLMMDQQADQGVWVTHSIPRFPPRLNEPLVFPESAQFYGQTFMCISFDLSKMGNMVVEHLRTMKPQVFDRRVSESLYEMMPNLKDLDTSDNLKARGKRIGVKPKLAQLITTSGGQLINLFSKSKGFDKDLYAGWIDEELGTALYVETWRRGAGNPLDSSCPADEYHINNVKDLKYDDVARWSYKNDHSKWAISEEEADAHVCIGDSNRMESQFKRGGGAVCIKCPDCWSIFSNTILDVEPCPRGSSKARRKQMDADQGLLKRIGRVLHL